MRTAGVLLMVCLARTAPAVAADAGICGRCHLEEATLGATTGGHAPSVGCEDCHRDRRPGRVGVGHRAIITSCGSHHTAVRHPPHGANRPGKPRRNCIGCHDPHGSPNLHLIRTSLFRTGPRRLIPIVYDSESGAAPGGFTDPARPGKGLCEVCHRRTQVYRADGRGQPHFAQSCVLCHDHEAGFQPVATEQNCAICHTAEAARFAKANLHSASFDCSGCHAAVVPTPGVGHRTVPACADCHTNLTHAPPGVPPFPCTQCHDPHGTDNSDLVLDQIERSQGGLVPIVFDNVLGQFDGSFASASQPGTGICEVCHTTTKFYRADGSGPQGHYTFSCLPCHRHAAGFNPP
ncbi:MAG TPA: hypothetical protein VKW76_04560 [Candidatus Binatia bacterium]|nr:hypothetical protein [Candidatus Binatia bacterium]